MIQITTRLFRAAALATLLCGVSTIPLFAQEPAGAPADSAMHHRHGPPPSALFAALDANHDGVISADEIANAPASLKTLLKNGATELKREDLRPARRVATSNEGTTTDQSDGTGTKADAQAGGNANHFHRGPHQNALFEALDTNHDGVISAEEIDQAPASLKTLLKNGATELKREDLRPARAPQQAQG